MKFEKSCPLPKTHNRLRQVHDLWHETARAYADVDEFTTKLNACIQAARSVTFVLRKEHSKSEGFDEWYEPWQDAMRGDSLLRWLVQARNAIEKEGDLDTYSRAVVTLAVGTREEVLTTLDVDPLSSPADVAAAVRIDDLDEQTRRDAVIVVERRWTVDALPDAELLDTLGHCYATLASVVREAHERCGVTMRTFADEGHAVKAVRFDHPTGRLPCMVATARHRTAYWHLGADTLLEWEYGAFADTLDVSDEDLDARYGADLVSRHRIHPSASAEERAKGMHLLARHVMSVDRFHGTYAWLYRGGTGVAVFDVTPDDQQDKAVAMRALAVEVDQLGADEVLYTAESWLASSVPEDDPRYRLRPGERDDRIEALLTYQLCRGEVPVMWNSMIKRASDGKIVFDDVLRDEVSGPNHFGPVLRVWDRWERGRTTP